MGSDVRYSLKGCCVENRKGEEITYLGLLKFADLLGISIFGRIQHEHARQSLVFSSIILFLVFGRSSFGAACVPLIL